VIKKLGETIMIRVENISKSFPGVKALDDVSLVFNSGEIHALLGENGAGKSTLMKIISGIYTADKGTITIDNKPVHFKHLDEALLNGLAIVNQEIQVIPTASVAENIMLDKLNKYKRFGLIDWRRLTSDVEESLKMVGLNVDPKTKCGSLSAAKKQLIQIARALVSNAKILMLDEPTSSITSVEVNKLFGLLREIKKRDIVIIFVSHKLDEVLEICDKISVLRDGKVIGTRNCTDITKQEIIKMMIGREMETRYMGHLDINEDDVVLSVKNISQKSHGFKNINFDLKRGEILGFYGLVGSGRTELAKIIIGDDRADSGEIIIKGKKVKIRSVADSLYKYKIGYVSENRKEEGLILSKNIKENVGITIWKNIRSKFTHLIKTKEEVRLTNSVIEKLEIKTPSMMQVVNNLSGGNQQKVSLGKWLAANCDILIIDEPTVGVDVGVKDNIHNIIWNLAKEEKKSIILISSDMPELIMLSRRILVFKESSITGEITGLNEGEFSVPEVSEKIGEYFA
jgi:ribose transport system ATP-binding protein